MTARGGDPIANLQKEAYVQRLLTEARNALIKSRLDLIHGEEAECPLEVIERRIEREAAEVTRLETELAAATARVEADRRRS